MSAPVPVGFVLEPDVDLRLAAHGRVLVGGAPLRVLRLSDSGAALVRRWFRGEPVGPDRREGHLARRLVDAGVAHPRPPRGHAARWVAIIPVRDDAVGVGETLDALVGWPGAAGAGRPSVVVVDDGSADPARLDAVVAGRATIVRPAAGVARATGPAGRRAPASGWPGLRRRPRSPGSGPGHARQAGLAEDDAAVVAFVDAGVAVTAADVGRLVDHLADPAVVAVAPRVASRPGPGAVARHEQRYSPLDLGPRPAPVRPGSVVPYVPTACLVVRRRAVDDVGGFDPGLRYGEDVDLLWRLAAAGGSVRYDPTVVVQHPPRPDLWRFLRQRAAYGSSAGPLARRHGAAVAPWRGSGWSLAVWALAVGGHPLAALALAGWTARALVPKLAALPDPGAHAVRLTAAGHWWAARVLSQQLVRTWWPATAAVAVVRPTRGLRLAVVGLVAGASQRRALRPTTIALGLAEDVAYGAGVWRGALRRGAARAVLPGLAPWPGRSRADAVTGR